MTRTFVFCLALGFAAVFSGCGESAKVEKKTITTTPGGTTTTTDTHKVESTGSNPPLSPSGEKAK